VFGVKVLRFFNILYFQEALIVIICYFYCGSNAHVQYTKSCFTMGKKEDVTDVMICLIESVTNDGSVSQSVWHILYCRQFFFLEYLEKWVINGFFFFAYAAPMATPRSGSLCLVLCTLIPPNTTRCKGCPAPKNEEPSIRGWHV